MADYDVGVTGLSSPPASAVLTAYRPAVSIRNNGIHNAIASGYLRIYAAGLLVFETEVYSGTLAPGASGTADAVDYWTPPAEGTYIVQGYVSTPLDQVEPNNNLAPVTIIVEGGPVPPEPPVPLHASQHEEGGTDPINVDGLPGVLANAQTPANHAAQHQAGQGDVLNVNGLAGVLGDPQVPTQHGNERHTPDMTTAAELSAHAGALAAHTAANNLANRETSGPLVGLVPSAQLTSGTEAPRPGFVVDDHAVKLDRLFGEANPVLHAFSHNAGGDDVLNYADPLSIAAGNNILTPGMPPLVFLGQSFIAAQRKTTLGFDFHAVGSLNIAAGGGQQLQFQLIYTPGGGAPVSLLSVIVNLPAPAALDFKIRGFVAANTSLNWQSGGDFFTLNPSTAADTHNIMQQVLLVPIQNANGLLQLSLTPIAWAMASTGNVSNCGLIGLS